MREDEERRLAEEAERNAQDLAESEERRRKREEFCQALNFEAAQLKFSRELTRAFTYSYMHSPTPTRIHLLLHAADALARTEGVRREATRQRVPPLPDIARLAYTAHTVKQQALLPLTDRATQNNTTTNTKLLKPLQSGRNLSTVPFLLIIYSNR